jgi:N6-adenosine-specific RNA methylase IME4
LAVKGKPKKQSSSVRQLVVTPIEKHSKKPDCVRDMIVQLCGDIPRIELFARQNVNGWDAWGNEVSESVNLEKFANNGSTKLN